MNHSASEYVVGNAHTNSIESFWAIIKRAHYGIHHYWSRKHLGRYIDEFAFKLNSKNLRAFDVTPGELGNTTVRAYVQGMEGRRLRYKDLIANG